jgi:hypothetical protein
MSKIFYRKAWFGKILLRLILMLLLTIKKAQLIMLALVAITTYLFVWPILIRTEI